DSTAVHHHCAMSQYAKLLQFRYFSLGVIRVAGREMNHKGSIGRGHRKLRLQLNRIERVRISIVADNANWESIGKENAVLRFMMEDRRHSAHDVAQRAHP